MTDGSKAIKTNELLDEFYATLHGAYDAMRNAFKLRSKGQKLTQDQIAEKLNIDKALVSKRLRGQENLTLKSLSFMATAMDCRLSVQFVPYEAIRAVHMNFHIAESEENVGAKAARRSSNLQTGSTENVSYRQAA